MGWFRRTQECPLPEPSRAWIYSRLQWFAKRFGLSGVRERPIFVPTNQYLPLAYRGTHEDVERLVALLSPPYGIDPSSLDVYLCDPDDAEQLGDFEDLAAAVFRRGTGDERPSITIRSDMLDDPPSLVGTLAHELAHALLHGGDHEEEPDLEPTTDLATVFFGLGVFTANAAIRSRGWHVGHMQYSQAGRLGYLSQDQFAFGLASVAWARGERKPPWVKHLRGDVVQTLRRSLSWFEAGNDAPLPAP